MRAFKAAAFYVFGVMFTAMLMFEVGAPLVITGTTSKIDAVTIGEVIDMTKEAPAICSSHSVAERDPTCSRLHRALVYIDNQHVTGPYEFRIWAFGIFMVAFLLTCIRFHEDMDLDQHDLTPEDALSKIANAQARVVTSLMVLGPSALLTPDLVERGMYAGNFAHVLSVLGL